jgi:hypothetical protein
MDQELFLFGIGRWSASGMRAPVGWEMETTAGNYVDIYSIRQKMTAGR